MAHVYASLAQLNDHIRDNGSSTFASEADTIKNRKLSILQAASRDIDEFCRRSRFQSGFGPRLGTNRYNGDGGRVLDLDDDLISITTLTIKADLTGSGTTYNEETDFVAEPFDLTPKRRLRVHSYGAGFTFLYGLRTVEVTGKFGYQDVRTVASATVNEALDTSETGVDVSAATEFSPGQTILVDSEQMYVRSIAGSTLTVTRAANGTTAATHNTAAAISIYEYPADVVDACLAVVLKRWKGRDAGADGSDGGGDVPEVRPLSERAILESRLRDYRFLLVA